jgi:diguanylate cyclase (GGDEF)-like protein
VLVDVAAIIKKSIRDADVAGRYGGEEFMVIFPDADLAKAANVSERIRRTIESHAFDDGLKITISGGVKQYCGEDLSAFIHSADMNLYEAKKNGKNQVVACQKERNRDDDS